MSTAIFTFAFENNFTRKYEFDIADNVTIADIKTAVNSVNASLAGGTAGGLDTFFISDDYDANNIGTFTRIIDVEINEEEKIPINIEAATEGEGD